MMKNLGENGSTPPLYGLVLAGGMSKRMGRDKGLLRWHGRAQRYYLADMLAAQCERTFISCREDQAEAIGKAGYHALPDSSPAKAQFGAILSALQAHPTAAWLVVACDLPLFNAEAMAFLVRQRDSQQIATAYRSADTGLPEPLAAIWEPRAREMLLRRFSDGVTCPRKALILSEPLVKLVDPPEPGVIMNINTPEAAAEVQGML